MSITSDVKAYADAAVEQGKQVVDVAQARLAKSANEAAKLADLDAVKGTVGGYLAQAKSATGAVVETMKEKVVAPALTLLGRRPAAPSRRTPRQPTTAAGPKRTATQKTAAASKAGRRGRARRPKPRRPKPRRPRGGPRSQPPPGGRRPTRRKAEPDLSNAVPDRLSRTSPPVRDSFGR